MRPKDAPPAPEPGLPPQEPAPLLATNLLPLIIGTTVVVLAVALGAYWLVTRQKATKPQGAKVATKVSPAPTSAASQVTPSADQLQTYSDATFGFRLLIPKSWQAAKRAEDADGYQTVFSPTSSLDAPITLNAQVNRASATLDGWVNALFGQAYPRERVKVAGIDALLLIKRSQNYKSYFVAHANNLFELSVSTVTNGHLNVFDQLIASLTFTR